MTCPTCSRSTRDFVNSSGLLTRCDDVWHSRSAAWSLMHDGPDTPPLPRHWLAEADSSASPARPDDFATQTPPAPHFPPPSHHGASERAYDASKDSHFPYTTPVPEPTTNGANGWIYCNACDAPQPTSGHECAVWTEAEVAEVERRADVMVSHFGTHESVQRAEFAESLLCAMAWDHGTGLGYIGERDCCRPAPMPWGLYGCPFCDAARGGGR